MSLFMKKNHTMSAWAKTGRVVFISATFVSCVFYRQLVAHADTTAIQGRLSQTQQEVNKLFQLMDQSGIPDMQKQQLEIDIKKKIIADVIAVSNEQIDTVRDEIKNAPFPQTSDWQKVSDGLNASLDADQSYYQTVTDAIATNPELTNDDIRSIASALENKKTNIIDPGIKHIETVLASLNIKNILTIADARQKKVGTDIDKIYAKNLTKNQGLKTAYQKASSLIADAHAANDTAQSVTLNIYADQNDSSTQDFMRNLYKEITQWEASSTSASSTPANADASTNATASTATAIVPDATATTTPSAKPTTNQMRSYVEALVLQSLNDIQSAYSIFMQMSKDVKKYL
jgi:hypothetical protein